LVMRMPLKVGDRAPDFELYDTELRLVRLSDLLAQGKVVILTFFPKAFTPGCTRQMCAFRDRMALLEKANAIVVGISVDDPSTLKKFKEVNRLNFMLLSDYKREVIRLYDVYHDLLPLPIAGKLRERMMFARRAVFILTPPEGRVAYAWTSRFSLLQPDYDEVVRVANEISSKLPKA
jgi:peroxiredoxin